MENTELLELELKNLLLILNAAPDKLPSRRVFNMIMDYLYGVTKPLQNCDNKHCK
jgi:hypothetical protein